MAKSFQSFGKKPQEMKYPHVHLSFDDHSVSNWHSCRELFNKYGAKATFYVDSFHLLSDEEIEMLRNLESDGHVIGCHGKTHADALVYSKRFSIEKYIEDEVLPSIEEMIGAGFKPTHFAFPYSHFDDVLYDELNSIFCYVRPGNESYYQKVERTWLIPQRMSKDETPIEGRIRNGDLDGVLKELRKDAKDKRGISIVLHDIRNNQESPHTGTHATVYVNKTELENLLECLNTEKYSYETYKDFCKYEE